LSSALGNPGKEHQSSSFQKEPNPEMNSRKYHCQVLLIGN